MFRLLALLILLVAIKGTVIAEPVRYGFADVGMSYTAAQFGDSPLLGMDVIGGRIVLEVEIEKGSAAAFVTDLALPIDPLFDNTNVVVLNGSDLGWSGTGTFRYEDETEEFNGVMVASRYGAATYGEGYSGRIVEGFVELDIPEYIRGDFNTNQTFDVQDIDLLSEQVRSESHSHWFDLNEDGRVNEQDRVVWVESKANTFFGDANLDGQFNSTDFVVVFQAAEYEDQVKKNSTWSTGDWNGDQEFDSSDFVIAFKADAFEQGPRPIVVPEPDSPHNLLIASLLSFLIGRRLIRSEYS